MMGTIQPGYISTQGSVLQCHETSLAIGVNMDISNQISMSQLGHDLISS